MTGSDSQPRRSSRAPARFSRCRRCSGSPVVGAKSSAAVSACAIASSASRLSGQSPVWDRVRRLAFRSRADREAVNRSATFSRNPGPKARRLLCEAYGVRATPFSIGRHFGRGGSLTAGGSQRCAPRVVTKRRTFGGKAAGLSRNAGSAPKAARRSASAASKSRSSSASNARV
jgi:hypothetical protein